MAVEAETRVEVIVGSVVVEPVVRASVNLGIQAKAQVTCDTRVTASVQLVKRAESVAQ